MFNTIKKILGMKHEIDSVLFRQALLFYPDYSDSTGSYLYDITKVTAEEWRGSVLVTIRTHRPGILIGANGVQIDGIKRLMGRMSGKCVDIYIVEEDMYSNRFGKK